MDVDRLARVAAAVASGTATDNVMLRAVACEGLTRAELVEVQRVLERSARLVMAFVEVCGSPRLDADCLPVRGYTSP